MKYAITGASTGRGKLARCNHRKTPRSQRIQCLVTAGSASRYSFHELKPFLPQHVDKLISWSTICKFYSATPTLDRSTGETPFVSVMPSTWFNNYLDLHTNGVSHREGERERESHILTISYSFLVTRVYNLQIQGPTPQAT